MAAWLILSDQKRIVDEEIAKLINANSETIHLDLNFTDISSIFQEINYGSLFESEKNLIVSNALIFSSAKINEKDEEMLINLLENPRDNARLIFVSGEKEDNRKKITKLIKEKGKIINLLQISPSTILEKVRRYCEKAGFSIEEASIKYLVDLTNQKYDLILNELDKLFLYYDNLPGEVRLADIKEICAPNIKDNNFKFADSIVNKNASLSFSLLKDLQSLKVEPSILLVLIVREYRLMLEYSIALKAHLLNEFIKNWHLQDWQINKIANNLKKYQEKELRQIIIKLADYDYKLKSGQIDRTLLLELIILDIVI